MATAFDDLIPQPKGDGGNAFGDLVPAKPSIFERAKNAVVDFVANSPAQQLVDRNRAAGRPQPGAFGSVAAAVPDSEAGGQAIANAFRQDRAANGVTTSRAGALARHAGRSVIPTVAGAGGFGAGFAGGGLVTAPAEAIPIAGPAVNLLGALIGGGLGAYEASKLADQGQEAALSALPTGVVSALGQDQAQRAADEQSHPTASFSGSLAPMLLTMRPGFSPPAAAEAPLLERVLSHPLGGPAIGATFAGGSEAAREVGSGEDLSPEKIAIATGTGAILNKPTRLGSALFRGGGNLVTLGAQRAARAAGAAAGNTNRARQEYDVDATAQDVTPKKLALPAPEAAPDGNPFSDLVPASTAATVAPGTQPVDPQLPAATEPPQAAPGGELGQSGSGGLVGVPAGEGAEVAAPVPSPQPLQEGEQYVRTPAGNKVRTRMEVVDASTLNKAQGGFQNRDRSRDTTALQVQDIISKFDPELLGNDPSSDRGAPIVGADDTVYSGNGRMLALNRVFDEHPDKAAAYRQFIESQGHSTEGIDRPVLVRRIAQDMTPDELRQFVVESNKDNKLTLSASEKARSDADYITPEMLSRYAGGDLNSGANTGFVEAFNKQLTAGELGDMIDNNRRLTPAGTQRIENAIVAHAYGKPQMLERMMESSNNDIRSITGSLASVAPGWARMREAAKSGGIDPKLDITDDLLTAAERVSEARRNDEKPADILTQADAFNPMTPATAELIRAFHNKDMTRTASKKTISEFLTDYTAAAEGEKASDGLFGKQEPRAPDAILKELLAKRDNPNGSSLFDALNKETSNDRPNQSGAEHERKRVDVAPGSLQRDARSHQIGGDGQAGGRLPASAERLDGSEAAARTGDDTRPMAPDRSGVGPAKAGASEDRARGRSADLLPGLEADQLAGGEQGSGRGRNASPPGDSAPAGSAAGSATAHRPGELLNEAQSQENVNDTERAPRRNEGGDESQVEAQGQGAAKKASGRPGGRNGGTSGGEQPEGGSGRSPADRSDAEEVADASPADASDGGPYIRTHAKGATTNRASDLRSAVEHLGMTWDDFNLKAPPAQMQLLQRAIREKLGIKVTVDHGELGPSRASIPYRVAIDQMLDAFHNVSGMAAVLGLPEKAMSLNGTLTLELRKSARFYGAFYPGLDKIALPGRSNSFAHEWGHALDYYLMGQMAAVGGNGGLSGLIRQQGKGVAGSGEIAERFTDLLNTMFFDKAALAGKIMELEAKIAATKSDKVKEQLQRQVERIKSGAGQHRTGRTTYYKAAKAVDGPVNEPGADYWQKPTEMLARAFEAYVAKKANDAGMSTEVISHADADYLSNADDRLAQTFPKGAERDAIFDAYDALFDTLGDKKALGKGDAAKIPENPARREEATPQQRNAFRNIVRGELGAFADWQRAREKADRQPKDRKGFAQKANDVRHFLFSGMAAEMRALGRRWNSRSIAQLHDLLVSEAGTGTRLQRRDFIMAARLRGNRYANSIGAALKDYGPSKVDFAQSSASVLSKGQAADVRAMMVDENHSPEFPELKTLASRLREISDGIWHDLRNAGFNIGYTRNGFLPRIYDVTLAEADMDGFLKQARKVYEAAGLEEDEARNAAAQWYHRLVLSSPHNFDQHTPNGDFLKGRELPPEADTLMADYMINEPMDLMRRYAESAAHRIEWARRFGVENEKLNALYDGMARERVDRRDIDTIRTMVDIMAGQNPMRQKNPTLNALGSGFNTIYGTVALLGRAVFQSLAESITAGVVLENPVYGVKAITDLIASTFGGASAKERRELASFIGLVDMTNHTQLLADRFGGSYDDPVGLQKINNKLFHNTGLIALTRAQYTHNMNTVNAYLVHLSHTLIDAPEGSASSREVLARFKELGIRDPKPFAQWMAEKGGPRFYHKTQLPTKDELAEGLDERGKSPWAFDWITATRRLSERIIQDPHAMTKPMLGHAGNIGKLVTGIQSFNYSGYENVLKPVIKRFYERAKDGRAGTGSKAFAATLAGFGMLFLGQLVSTAVRVFLTDRERWRQEEEAGTLQSYLAQRTSSNFVGDPLDPAVQAVAGLKYNRPLATSVEGPAAGNFLANATDIIAIGARNSRKTNTAEHNALNGAYRLMSPWASAGVGSIPGGPIVSGLEGAAQGYITSPQAGQDFATAFVGPKNGRIDKDGNKVKSGPTAFDLFLDQHFGKVERKKRGT